MVGGGLELAAATHIRVAERSTFYALPEGQRGLFVGGGVNWNMRLDGRDQFGAFEKETGDAIGLQLAKERLHRTLRTLPDSDRPRINRPAPWA